LRCSLSCVINQINYVCCMMGLLDAYCITFQLSKIMHEFYFIIH